LVLLVVFFVGVWGFKVWGSGFRIQIMIMCKGLCVDYLGTVACIPCRCLGFKGLGFKVESLGFWL